MGDLSVSAAVNDHLVLEQCLAASPDIKNGALPLTVYEGFRTSGAAYNKALTESDGRWLLLAHQDVYLPSGFSQRVHQCLAELTVADPDWAVAGLVGATNERVVKGHIWCSGNQKIIGDGQGLPAKVDTIDELAIIIRTDAGLQFDEALPSFHLYGADIVLQAAKAGRTTWVIDSPVVHHSKPVIDLGGGYADAYRYMQRKWADSLPVFNLCCPITASPLTRWVNDLRIRAKNRGTRKRREPLGEPAEIAKRLGFES
jgi:hypothetical protein